jgi:hypothetical protein
MKPAGSAPLTAGNATTSGTAHKVSVAGQPVKIDVLKKAVQKMNSGDAATDGGAVSPSNSNSDKSAANPVTPRPKAPNIQFPSQPTATEENPH